MYSNGMWLWLSDRIHHCYHNFLDTAVYRRAKIQDYFNLMVRHRVKKGDEEKEGNEEEDKKSKTSSGVLSFLSKVLVLLLIVSCFYYRAVVDG